MQTRQEAYMCACVRTHACTCTYTWAYAHAVPLLQGGASELVALPAPLARLINTAAALAAGTDPIDLPSAAGGAGGATALPGAVSPGSVAEALLPLLRGTGACTGRGG